MLKCPSFLFFKRKREKEAIRDWLFQLIQKMSLLTTNREVISTKFDAAINDRKKKSLIHLRKLLLKQDVIPANFQEKERERSNLRLDISADSGKCRC